MANNSETNRLHFDEEEGEWAGEHQGRTREEARSRRHAGQSNYGRLFPRSERYPQASLPPHVKLDPDMHSHEVDLDDIDPPHHHVGHQPTQRDLQAMRRQDNPPPRRGRRPGSKNRNRGGSSGQGRLG